MNAFCGFALGIALLATAAPVRSAEIEGVRFADRIQVGDADLQLRGTGLLRYRMIFKGYVAALYLEESGERSSVDRPVLADVPRRLEIEYFWSIPARGFAEATIAGISQNTDAATFERLRGSIEELNALYEDIEAGDRYALTYLPDVGTILSKNDRTLGVVEGAEFSSALFAIWLGNQPLDESLRNQLLAGR